MARTLIQRAFAPFKTYLPKWIWMPIRGVATAVLTPIRFSYRSGHFRSSLKRAAVARDGSPLPWYTYPCIEFLAARSFTDKSVLEFGGGHSTMWWAARAKHVVTIDDNAHWYDRLKRQVPANVDLHHITFSTVGAWVADVERAVRSVGATTFDVIIIDGHHRSQTVAIARRYLTADGMIICDDSEGHGVFAALQHSGLNRVDFFGYAPGVVLPHCTSIVFGPNCFALKAEWPIPTIARL